VSQTVGLRTISGESFRLAPLRSAGRVSAAGGAPAALRLSFSGKQPENCEILSLLLRNVRLRWRNESYLAVVLGNAGAAILTIWVTERWSVSLLEAGVWSGRMVFQPYRARWAFG